MTLHYDEFYGVQSPVLNDPPDYSDMGDGADDAGDAGDSAEDKQPNIDE